MATIKEGRPRRKPVFGPAVNRAIFEEKWSEKFHAVDNKHAVPRDKLSSRDDLLAFQKALVRRHREKIHHIHFFDREAEALGFHLPEKQELQKEPQAMHTMLAAITLARVCIHTYAEHAKKRKNGRQPRGTIRWKDYPLQLRREINDLLEAIRKEEESGYWIVDDETFALSEMMQREFEAPE